jgi:Winged helix-turn-helix DNA-binding
MSLLDQVRKLEQQVVERLKELEPLTREYEQLRKVAERLGVKYTPGSAESRADAKPSKTARRGGTRAARGAAKTQPARSPARARTATPAVKPRGKRSTTSKRAASTADATGASGTATPARRAKRDSSGGQRAGGRRAATARPGQRHGDVLRLVGENPGITVREIGERLGVDATGLYRVVKRLTEEGRLRKDGPRLHPVESPTASPPRSEAAPSRTAETPPRGATEAPEATVPVQSESSTAATDAGSPGDT